ncbi:hypothetical protein NECAME_12447 [Necator americanus]|uniref:Uncharacterized protein n=1 Tax=Necator americanus TaxID=51031 RepID=W2T0E3_NECAM|nr:hypothetical protein NECAME_12447 [Necator americanus]ETN75353.1 hypothetical protein NECAME_12447 [Necator americanus]
MLSMIRRLCSTRRTSENKIADPRDERTSDPSSYSLSLRDTETIICYGYFEKKTKGHEEEADEDLLKFEEGYR